MSTATHPLREYRQREKLTRKQLGAKLGVTGMTIYRWETGERLPQRGQWAKIAEVTGIAASTLVGSFADAGATA